MGLNFSPSHKKKVPMRGTKVLVRGTSPKHHRSLVQKQLELFEFVSNFVSLKGQTNGKYMVS